jgi:hypothetical protein
LRATGLRTNLKEKVQGLGHKAKEMTGDRTDKVEEQERRP